MKPPIHENLTINIAHYEAKDNPENMVYKKHMKTHNIPLDSIIAKRKTNIKIENGEFYIPAEMKSKIKERHYAYIPGKFKLPFRIDMTAKISIYKINARKYK